MLHPGIAIITYKRPAYLDSCLAAVRAKTSSSHEIMVFCDSDDDPESQAVCAKHRVDAIFAQNQGVVWNKNRGLFHFMARTSCDPIILLEDDTVPTEPDWLGKWVEAAGRWHHVNFSHPALFSQGRSPFSGDGTPQQPHIHGLVTGQCTAVSRHAMQVGGYLDTRFKGYGHGHVEWTRRHARLLYKGIVPGYSDTQVLFVSIHGGLKAENAPSFRNEEDVARNGLLLGKAINETQGYMEPWQSDAEKETLLREIDVPRAPEPDEKAVVPSPSSAPIGRGHVDSLSGKHDRFFVRGWAARQDGTPVPSFLVRIGDRTVDHEIVRRMDRTDVVRVHPDIRLGSGFELAFELPEDVAMCGQDVAVMPVEDGIVGRSLRVSKSAVWPPAGWHPVPDSPTMPPECAARLEQLLRGSRCYLEYGAGGSTVMASDLGVPVVLSVESDRDWLAAVGRKLARRSKGSEVIQLHIDLGPIKDWGFPVADTHWKNYSNYPLLAWEECIRRSLKPDLVLIDGRFRVASFMATLLFAQPGCRILLDDYGDRPDCKVVERFVRPEAMAGRMGEFVVPADLPRDQAWLAFVQACTDVG